MYFCFYRNMLALAYFAGAPATEGFQTMPQRFQGIVLWFWRRRSTGERDAFRGLTRCPKKSWNTKSHLEPYSDSFLWKAKIVKKSRTLLDHECSSKFVSGNFDFAGERKCYVWRVFWRASTKAYSQTGRFSVTRILWLCFLFHSRLEKLTKRKNFLEKKIFL